MDALIWVIAAIVVIAVIAVVVMLAQRRRREDELRRRFGPEYDRAVRRTGSPREAQAQLTDVARRRDQLDITDLNPQARARFDEAWLAVQTRFVDEPGQAVTDADGLVTAVMRARGYPVEDFEERAWMLAADHGDVVEHYRKARGAHTRHLQAGSSDTEDLRQAFVHYRLLFGVLSGRREGDPGPGSGATTGAHTAEPYAEPYPAGADAAEPYADRPDDARADAERARADADSVDADQADADRVDADRADAARADAERARAESAGAYQPDADRAHADRADADRIDADRVDADRVDADRPDRADADRADADRADADRPDRVDVDSAAREERPTMADRLLHRGPANRHR